MSEEFSTYERAQLTDFDIGALIVGNARVGGTEIDTNGTVVYFVRHDEFMVWGGDM